MMRRASTALIAGLLVALATAVAPWVTTSSVAAERTLPARLAHRICPSVSAQLAYVSHQGVVICRHGHGRIVVRRSDVGELRWSANGAQLDLQVGNTFLRYDLRSRQLLGAEDPYSACQSTCAIERGRFEYRRIDRRDHQPFTPALGSVPVTLNVRIDKRTATYTTPIDGDVAVAAGRPDRSGVLFWNLAHRSASAFSDAISLWDLTPRYGARPYKVDGFPMRRWLAFSPDGHELVLVAGRYREVFEAPHELWRCSLSTAHCVAWHSPPGFVELDPAWSPDGRSVAFVRAPIAMPSQLSDGYPGATWNRLRRLLVVDVRSGREREIVGIGGAVFEPHWLTRTVLIAIANDELLEIDTAHGKVTPLGALAQDPRLFYGAPEGRGGRLAVIPPL